MLKKLYISLIFSNLAVKFKTTKITAMHNLYANFVKILEVCKHFFMKDGDVYNKKLTKLVFLVSLYSSTNVIWLMIQKC